MADPTRVSVPRDDGHVRRSGPAGCLADTHPHAEPRASSGVEVLKVETKLTCPTPCFHTWGTASEDLVRHQSV